MLTWLHKNLFWVLAAMSGVMTFVAVLQDNVHAMLAYVLLFCFSLAMGVYFSNRQFVRDVLSEYDEALQRQLSQKNLRVVKGGKPK